MSVTLNPYPEYKDSGASWLGLVPAHWTTARIKNIFREVDQRSGDGRGTLLSLTRARGLIRQSEASKRMPSAEDLTKYKVCEAGQLVMNRMQAWSGMFATATDEGLVSPDYSVFQSHPDAEVSYFEFLFKTPLYVQQFAQRSKGIGTGFNRLYTPDFGAIRIPVPPRREQQLILWAVQAFTYQTARFIQVKRRLIALLNEQKQAIIHRAVTRGLDPDVRLKASGVEWLGDVPEHWAVVRLKNLFNEIDDRSETGTETLLSLRMYLGLVPHNNVSNIRIENSALIGFKRVAPGQVVMNRMRAAIGLFGVAQQPGIVSPDYAVFEPNTNVDPRYFVHLFKTRAAGTVFRLESKGLGTGSSGFMRLYSDRFGMIKVSLPPLMEQRLIVRAIADQTAEIEQTVKRIEREIDLIREYRTRLIADVVTGKLDVRGVELLPLDEAADLGSLDGEVTSDLMEDGEELELMEEGADAGD